MSTRRNGRIPADERSAFPSVRGLPAWAATLLAVAICLTGVVIDAAYGELGSAFTVAYVLGCVAAVLSVARGAVYFPAVSPPIIMAVLVPLVYMIAGAESGADLFSRSQILAMALPLASRFPLMVATTVVVLTVALIRVIVLEPRVARTPPSSRKSAAHARH